MWCARTKVSTSEGLEWGLHIQEIRDTRLKRVVPITGDTVGLVEL